jgi:hypothetical protein
VTAGIHDIELREELVLLCDPDLPEDARDMIFDQALGLSELGCDLPVE